ncbi:MAG: hypothetical protein H6710_14925 [Myxococcales bacterium]|nr:hypothetical protein [Myxococcales bacterium]
MIGTLPPRFVDVRRLGEGSEGGTWVGHDRDARARKVVLKHVPAARGAHVRRAFEVLRRVASPHLPAVLELLPADDGGAWLVTAWVEGEPLPTGPVPAAQALAEAVAITHALRAIHAVGTHHGDVSLGNLLVRPDGGIVLTDFGQVGCYGAGTPGFLAPEVLGGGGGPASDVFALGCVLGARLFGAPPWRDPAEVAGLPGRGRGAVRARIGELQRRLGEAIDPRLFTLFDHLLDPDPEGRVSDLGALLGRLGELREGGGGGATWWLPARWPYRGLDLERWVDLLAGAGRPCLVAIAGPTASGRGRVVEELVQRLQARDPAALRARLCTPERLAGARGGDDEGWLAAWMAGDGERGIIGVGDPLSWPGELADASDPLRQARLQAAVLRAGAAQARDTLILPVSPELGEILSEGSESSLVVIRLRPWGIEEIRGALASTLEGAGEEGTASWASALAEVSGGWPARVVGLIVAAAHAGIRRPGVEALARLPVAGAPLDPLVARELLTVAWELGRRSPPVPPAMIGLYASDGEPLPGALAAARRVLGDEADALARELLAAERRQRRPIRLALAVDAGDRPAIEAWLAAAPPVIQAEPALERLAGRVLDGMEVRAAARTILARHLLRLGDAARALAVARPALADPEARLLCARALEQLGRPADALDVLEDMLKRAGTGGATTVRPARAGPRRRARAGRGRGARGWGARAGRRSRGRRSFGAGGAGRSRTTW